MAPFQVDLRNGALRQIAEAEKLDYRSLCLDRSQKAAYFLDGDRILEAALGKGSNQTVAQGVTWFRLGADGALFAVQEGKLVLREGSGWGFGRRGRCLLAAAERGGMPVCPHPERARESILVCRFQRSK